MSRATALGLKHPGEVPHQLHNPTVSFLHTCKPTLSALHNLTHFILLFADDLRWPTTLLQHKACK